MVIKYFDKEHFQQFGLLGDAERKSRKTTANLISIAGKELKLLQWTIARATIDCNRFFAVKSPQTNNRFLVSTASLFLAAKADDSPRALADVLEVCWKVWHRNKPVEQQLKLKDPTQAAFVEELRENVLMAERSILYCRGFDMSPPHAFVSLMAQLKQEGLMRLTPEQNATPMKNMLQTSWNFVNDSLHTTLPLQYNPELIAKAAIYLGAEVLKVDVVPDNKTFAEHFAIDPEVLRDIKSQILDLYDCKEPAATAVKPAPAADGAVGHPPASQDGPQEALEEDEPQVLPAKVEGAKVEVKVEEANADTGIKDGKQTLANGDMCRPALSNGTASRKRKADAATFQDVPAMKALRAGNC